MWGALTTAWVVKAPTSMWGGLTSRGEANPPRVNADRPNPLPHCQPYASAQAHATLALDM
jgi:hypothetical protein